RCDFKGGAAIGDRAVTRKSLFTARTYRPPACTGVFDWPNFSQTPEINPRRCAEFRQPGVARKKRFMCALDRSAAPCREAPERLAGAPPGVAPCKAPEV